MTAKPRTVVTALCLTASLALAQNQQPTAEQYQDALNQLRQLQADKNELATKNRDLQKKLHDLEEQQEQTTMRLETLENRMFYLREHYAAWQAFLELNPPIRVMWNTYFTTGEVQERIMDLLGDGKWPFGIES